MITTTHNLDTTFNDDIESTEEGDHLPCRTEPWEPWNLPELGEDTPDWDDWRLVEVARSELDERDAVLGQLAQLTLSSLGCYQELVDLATESRLQSFAEVMVRQRHAQCQALVRQIRHWDNDPAERQENLTLLRSAWRCALWNYEQNRLVPFAEFAERAEALLEDAYLMAANLLQDKQWAQEMNAYAVMVCGARALWEDTAGELARAALHGDLADVDQRELIAAGQ